MGNSTQIRQILLLGSRLQWISHVSDTNLLDTGNVTSAWYLTESHSCEKLSGAVLVRTRWLVDPQPVATVCVQRVEHAETQYSLYRMLDGESRHVINVAIRLTRGKAEEFQAANGLDDVEG